MSSGDRCKTDLMARAAYRVEQEVARLGGRYAHVFDEPDRAEARFRER